MWRKKIKIIFILLSIIFIFTGISFASSHIKLWMSWEGKSHYQKIMDKFTEEKGIKVEIVYVPKIVQKIKTLAKGNGDLPDIALIRDSSIPDLAESGIIKPISEKNQDISNRGKFAFTYKDKLYGVPFYFDTQIVFYNPTLFKKAGIDPPNIDWTLKDLEEYGKKLKKIKGIIPFGWGAYSSYYFAGFEHSFKEDCIKCQTKLRFFTSATEKAVLFYKKLIKEKIGVSLDRNAILSGFKEGKIGMTIFGTFIIPDFIKDKIDFAIAPLPINDKTGKRVASYLDYKGFVIFKELTNDKNIQELLTFLAKEDIQFAFCYPLYKFPDNEYALSKVLEKNPYLSKLRVTVNSGIFSPKEEIYQYYNKALSNVLKLILSKNIPINKAFEAGKKYLKGKK